MGGAENRFRQKQEERPQANPPLYLAGNNDRERGPGKAWKGSLYTGDFRGPTLDPEQDGQMDGRASGASEAAGT